MKVFDRVRTLLRADAHGLMDQLEERSLLLKQHLREAEMELAHKRARLETLDEEQSRLAEEARRQTEQVAALDADVELALRGDDAELARFAVRRLLPRKEALDELLAHAGELGERRTRLEAKLHEQEALLAELRPRVRAQLQRVEEQPRSALFDAAVSDEEVELELLRRRAGQSPSARHEPGGTGQGQGQPGSATQRTEAAGAEEAGR